MESFSLRSGILFGFLMVLFGAFGAHGLKDVLTEESRLTYQTGIQYGFWHAGALVMHGLYRRDRLRGLGKWIEVSFFGGITVFTGSLILYSLTGLKWIAMLTPVGGVFFLGGWLLWAMDVRKLL